MLKKIYRFLILLDGLRFTFGLLKMVMNPKNVNAIFDVRAFRNHKSLKYALNSLHSIPEIHNLIKERYLAPKPYELDDLLLLKDNSLGKVYAEHMKKNNLEVVFYPKMDSNIPDDINYLRMRARQTHDIHHVVLDFPATDVGEMAISAFYLAQNKIPLSGLLIGCGFITAVLKYPERIEELVEHVIKGWFSGKNHNYFLGIKWEELFEKDIDEVRSFLKKEKTHI